MNSGEESLVWKGSPSQWTNLGTFFFCVVLAAGIVAVKSLTTLPPVFLWGLAVPVLWAFFAWLADRCQVYEITSERVLITVGLLSRRTTELELYRVRDYAVIQPFFLRLLGRGHIQLMTADRSSPALELRAVPHAVELKDKIRANTEIMRRRRVVRDLEIDSPPTPPPA